jgi:hypothetical protein
LTFHSFYANITDMDTDDAPNPELTENKQDKPTSQQLLQEKARKLYDHLRPEADRLRDLYNEGMTEEVAEMVDQIAEDLYMADAESAKNRNALIALRNSSSLYSRDKEAALAARQQELLAQYRHLVVLEAGLPDEVSLAKIEKAKKNVEDLLKDGDFSGSDSSEALRILGITTVVGDKEVYTFPAELMTDDINEKWENYKAVALKHEQDSFKFNSKDDHSVSQAQMAESAGIRTSAHTSLTADVHNVLGLEGINKWSLADTREVIAKCLTTAFPDHSHTISGKAQEIIDSHSHGINVTKALFSAHH